MKKVVLEVLIPALFRIAVEYDLPLEGLTAFAQMNGFAIHNELDGIVVNQEYFRKTSVVTGKKTNSGKGKQLKNGPPKSIAIDHDEYSAEYLGKTEDGRQFFLTTPFVPADSVGSATGREYLALYLFDKSGALLSATIDDFGPRSKVDQSAMVARRDQLLASLGTVKYCRIKVAPFKVERFGVEFGFIPQPPEEEGEDWSVIVEPGNYMCFWPPWTSGDYDT